MLKGQESHDHLVAKIQNIMYHDRFLMQNCNVMAFGSADESYGGRRLSAMLKEALIVVFQQNQSDAREKVKKEKEIADRTEEIWNVASKREEWWAKFCTLVDENRKQSQSSGNQTEFTKDDSRGLHVSICLHFCIFHRLILRCEETVGNCHRMGFENLCLERVSFLHLLGVITSFPDAIPDNPGQARATRFGIPGANIVEIGRAMLRPLEINVTSEDPATKLSPFLRVVEMRPRVEPTGKIRAASLETIGSSSFLDPFSYGCSFIAKAANDTCNNSINYGGARDYSVSGIEVNNGATTFGAAVPQMLKDGNRIAVITVPAPSHIYHAIVPLFYWLRGPNEDSPVIANGSLDPGKILFCEPNCGIEAWLRQIEMHSCGNAGTRELFFILHPEALLDREREVLRLFIDHRAKSRKRNDRAASVAIITSLGARHFIEANHPNHLDLNRAAIQKLADATGYVRFLQEVLVDIVVVASRKAGVGKTSLIRSVFGEVENVYLDVTSPELPPNLGETTHVELSPEVFRNNFTVFDRLWQLVTLSSIFRKDSRMVSFCDKVPSRADPNTKVRRKLVIEMPVIPESQNFAREDFPIALLPDEEEPDGCIPGFGTRFLTLEPQEVVQEINEPSFGFLRSIFDEPPTTYRTLVLRCFDVFGFRNLSEVDDLRVMKRVQKYVDFMFELLQKFGDIPETRYVGLLILRSLLEVVFGGTDGLSGQKPGSILVSPDQILSNPGRDGDNNRLSLFGVFESFVVVYDIQGNDTWNMAGIGLDFGNPISRTISERDAVSFIENMFRGSRICVFRNVQGMGQIGLVSTLLAFCSHDMREKQSPAQLAVALRDEDLYPSARFSDIISSVRDGMDVGAYRPNMEGGEEWDNRLKGVLKKMGRDCHPSKEEVVAYLMENMKAKTLLASVQFSKTYTVRLIRIIIQLVLGMFPILKGETGIGKTMTINLIASLTEEWLYEKIDLHGAITQEWVEERFRQSFGTDTSPRIILLDELNTTVACSYVVNYVLNRQFDNVLFVACINELVKVDPLSRQLSRCGIPQVIPKRIANIRACKETDKNAEILESEEDSSVYRYSVVDLPSSADPQIMNVDPAPRGSPDYYFCDEEFQIGRAQVASRLRSMDVSTYGQKFHELHWKPGTQDIIERAIMAFIRVVFASVREFQKSRAILSGRDIDKVMDIYEATSDSLLDSRNENDEELLNRAIVKAIVIAIDQAILMRFPEQIDLDLDQGMREDLKRRIDAFNDFHNRRIFVPEDVIRRRCLGLRAAITESLLPEHVLQDSDFNGRIVDILKDELMSYADWKRLSSQYSYFRVAPLLDGSNKIRTPALMANLLAIDTTVQLFKKGSSSCTSLLMIGPPGASKTMSPFLYRKKNERYKLLPYLCSRTSDAQALLDQLQECAAMGEYCIVLLDEVGLLNLTSSLAAKFMHSIYDQGVWIGGQYRRVIFIETSNYAMDPAVQNRVFLCCCSPTNRRELADCLAMKPIRFANASEWETIKRGFLGQDDVFENWYNEITNVHRENPDADVHWYDKIIDAIITCNGGLDISPTRPFYRLVKLLENPENRRKREVTSDLFEKIALFLPGLLGENGYELAKDPHRLATKFCQELFGQDVKLPRETISPLSLLQHILSRAEEGKRFVDESVLIRIDNDGTANLITFILKEVFHQDVEVLCDPGIRATMEEAADSDLQKILQNGILSSNLKPKVFNVIGNVVIADGMLDGLNVREFRDVTGSPTLVDKGYPLRLSSCARNMRFVFVLKESEVQDKNSFNPVPLPLLDRLVHIAVDRKIILDWMGGQEGPCQRFLNRQRLVKELGHKKSDMKWLFSERRNEWERIDISSKEKTEQWLSTFQTGTVQAILVTRTPPRRRLVFHDGPFRVRNEDVNFVIDASVDDPGKNVQGVVIRHSSYYGNGNCTASDCIFVMNELNTVLPKQVRFRFIVISVETNKIPIELRGIPDWNTFWIEDLSDSVMSEFTIRQLADAQNGVSAGSLALTLKISFGILEEAEETQETDIDVVPLTRRGRRGRSPAPAGGERTVDHPVRTAINKDVMVEGMMRGGAAELMTDERMPRLPRDDRNINWKEWYSEYVRSGGLWSKCEGFFRLVLAHKEMLSTASVEYFEKLFRYVLVYGAPAPIVKTPDRFMGELVMGFLEGYRRNTGSMQPDIGAMEELNIVAGDWSEIGRCSDVIPEYLLGERSTEGLVLAYRRRAVMGERSSLYDRGTRHLTETSDRWRQFLLQDESHRKALRCFIDVIEGRETPGNDQSDGRMCAFMFRLMALGSSLPKGNEVFDVMVQKLGDHNTFESAAAIHSESFVTFWTDRNFDEIVQTKSFPQQIRLVESEGRRSIEFEELPAGAPVNLDGRQFWLDRFGVDQLGGLRPELHQEIADKFGNSISACEVQRPVEFDENHQVLEVIPNVFLTERDIVPLDSQRRGPTVEHWFLDNDRDLFDRQLSDLLVLICHWPEQFEVAMKVFERLIDPWNAPPSSGPRLCYFVWNTFLEKLKARDAPTASQMDGLIRTVADEVFGELDVLMHFSQSCPWRFLEITTGGKGQFLTTGKEVFHFDRMIYFLAMFGHKYNATHPLEIDMSSLFAFLRALPFAGVAKHVSTISWLLDRLMHEFARQPNLAYVVLKASNTCAAFFECLKKLKMFTPGDHSSVQHEEMQRLEGTLTWIDGQEWCEAKSAYDRLSRYMNRACEIHHDLIGLAETRQGRLWVNVRSDDLVDQLGYVTGLLPAVASSFESNVSHWQRLAVALQTVFRNRTGVEIVWADEQHSILGHFEKRFAQDLLNWIHGSAENGNALEQAKKAALIAIQGNLIGSNGETTWKSRVNVLLTTLLCDGDFSIWNANVEEQVLLVIPVWHSISRKTLSGLREVLQHIEDVAATAGVQ